ncbi:MAG TPA: Ig-like domain-containing protein [Thermoleophilaceae bacterium]|nr:Ig-like domain-containing protein [Thermoleophilaceae bacterium]
MQVPRPYLVLGVVALVLLTFLVARTVVFASPARFAVDSTADAVDSQPGDGSCRTVAGACTLRAAIQEANALPGADEIQLPGGTYALGIAPQNQNDATSGDLDITDSLTVTGAGAGSTHVDARTLDRVFEVADDGGSVAFSGLTISNGDADEYGGGILNSSTATVTVQSSTVRRSVAGKTGGGIDNHVGGEVHIRDSNVTDNFARESGSAINNNRDGTVTITASTVSSNSAADVGLDELLAGGGAISNNAELDTAGTITVIGSQVSDNRAGGGRSGAAISNDGTGKVVVEGTTFSKNRAHANGGAIFNGSGEVRVAGSRFTENSATNGGAIYSSADKDGRVTVSGSTFTLNHAAGDGGAIVGTGTGHLEVLDGTFSKNDADDWGGAVQNANKGSAAIERSSFTENTALNGGGFANEGAGLVVVESSMFTKNMAVAGAILASGEGGGMHSNSGGEVVVSGGAFTDNKARSGGGFSNAGGGTVEITGTRFAANHAEEQGGGLLIESGAVRMLNIDVVGNVADGDEEAGGGISYAGDKAVGVGETSALELSRIRDNKAKGPGGGVDSRGDGPLAITTTTIAGNTAAIGGAVHHVGDAPLLVTRSTLSGNFAESGGGVFSDGDGEATVENTTVSGNRAGQFGGGLLVSSRLTMRNSTVTSNSAPSGAGVDNGGGALIGDGLVFLLNTIVAGNTTGGNCAGAITSLGGNLENANTCVLRQLTDHPGTDPLLGPLADNGGPTQTHALLAGSPAQENALCTELDPCPSLDQRGVERPRYDSFDIGAYESELTPGSAGEQRCAGYTERPVLADFDSWVSEGSPGTNYGNDSILKVDAQGSANERALVHFDLPPTPPGCKLVAASLRLHASSAAAGRTLEAVRIASAWSEQAITWGNQPAVAGPVAQTESGPETREWDVLAQTLDMYAHGEHGFLIRDAVETGTGEQSFHSGEKGPEHPPELILVFDDPSPTPLPGTCPTTPQSLSADRDSWVSQSSAASNFGSDSALKVKSQSGANSRALIRFPLPLLPAACTSIASATLRVEAASAKEGRTLEALQAAGAWSESGVTWANQPGVTGPAATVASALGQLEWDVTDHLLGMYTSGNRGFVIRDASENGAGDEQTLNSRHKLTDGPPQLVLAFDDSTPETVIDSGPDAVTDSVTATFRFSSDRDDASFQCSLDGAAFTACTSPYSLDGLAEGDHRLDVRATRPIRAVDPTPASYEWKVAIPPKTTIVDGPVSPSDSANVALAFTADDPDATFECSLNGVAFEECTSPVEYTNLADGANEVRVRATDPLGNVEPDPAAHAWTVAVPPAPTIDSGPDRLTGSTVAGFEFSGTDNGPAPAPLSFECRLDAGAWEPCSSPHGYGAGPGQEPLPDGTHVFELRATDATGNQGEASYQWTVDTVAPAVAIGSFPDRLTRSTEASFEFDATDEGPAEPPLRLECKLDGGEWEACSSPQAYGGTGADALPDGDHVFVVRATDGAGNVGEASYEWTVDTVAPVAQVDGGPATLTKRTDASFHFSATDEGPAEPPLRFECRLDAGEWEPCSSPQGYGGEGPAALPDGKHVFAVRAIDGAENVGESASYEWTVDTVAPKTTITSGPDRLTNVTKASFAFAADEDATFECRLDEGGWVPCENPKDYGAGPGDPRLPDGSHVFAVRATDGADNLGEAVSYEWTVDTVAPKATIGSGPDPLTNQTEASFEFEADEDATFECKLDTGEWTSCTSPQSYRAGPDEPPLTDGEHTFSVRATDRAHNLGVEASYSWTLDTVAPVASIVSGPDLLTNQTEASFEFEADEDATFECKLDTGEWTSCTSPQSYRAGPGEPRLTDGEHVFVVRPTDVAGNLGAEESYGWTVDTVAPVASIGSRPDRLTNRAAATFEFAADEQATFECKLDAGDWTNCTSPQSYGAGPDEPPLTDGEHTFSVRATDRARNLGVEASYSWTVDTAEPVASIGSGPDRLTGSTEATFEFSGADNGPAEPPLRFECSLDGGGWTSCNSPQSYGAGPGGPPLGDGQHLFMVRAGDGAGNVGEAVSYDWTVDTVAPQVSIDSRPESLTKSTEASFEFSAGEDASFECRLDEGDWVACESPQTYGGAGQTPLADGRHTFEVRATDRAGNVGAAASYSWTVDTVAPTTTITSKPSDPSDSRTATFAFSAEGAASLECKLDAGAWLPCMSPHGYTDLADGEHTFQVRATDVAGNQGSAASYTWTIDTTAPDTTAPDTSITAAPAALSTSTSASFSFTGSDNETSQSALRFECRLDSQSAAAFASCSSPSSYTGLSQGSHTFEVRAIDAAGNVDSTPASHTWTVDTVVPLATITSGPSGPTNDSTPTFAFSSEAGASFQCRVDNGAFAACSSPHTTAALADGAHTFEVWATDAAGNTGAAASRAFTVDTVAPQTTVDSGPSGLTNDSTPTFGFSSEAGASFHCRVDAAAFAACSSPLTTGALSDGAHTFEVRATDAAGNTDASPASRAITVDTAAPQTTITTAPPATTSSTSAEFGVNSNDSGATFECSLDGAAFATCTSPRIYSGLAVGTHQFGVRARDAAGNLDASPATHSWTITAPQQGCGSPATALAAADAWVDENSPTNNKGTDSILKVQSKGPRDNFRALVRFTLPAVPEGCAVESATLRLYSPSAKTPRTIQALRLASAWSENLVNWSNQPLTIGPAATAAAGTGYREWSVTSQVQAMYTEANHGFLIRDSVEGQDAEQQFHSREKGENPPQLVVRFVAAGP